MKPKKIWIISDTHFNHPAIIDFEDRPKDYQAQIIRKWNNNVSDDDIVLHLWDVIFDRPSELEEILSLLKGTKILVRWNHDKRPINFYLRKGFDFAMDSFEFTYWWKDILFTHIPKTKLKEWQINIHWHCHSKWHREFNLTSNHLLYSAEIENYMPLLLTNMLKRL